MKATLKRRKGFTLVELLVVIVIIAALAGLSAPVIMKQRKKADLTEATNNARQIGIALLEFENEYGSYPDKDTAEAVTNNTGSQLTLTGSTSNDMFRQLIATNMAPNEVIFYAKTKYTKKPDQIANDSSHAIAPGECGFGYLMNGTTALSSSGNPGRPLVVAPLNNASTSGEFDPEIYDNKAVALRGDNSVGTLNIRQQDKQAVLSGAKTLLQTGDDTLWGTDVTPTIVPPAKKN